ncbi:kinesin-like protein KIF20B [Conger conger]|uniref:kinesin-like protein KIF20B n=1 Tax=Conger conger TaxID=82655 RepID=UPI002A5A2B4F|nr:kinesin-like protein KIF20B [Conger conger]
MMESCFNSKIERTEPVTVDDLKKDLFADFSAIPSVLAQDSSVLEKEHLRVYLRIRPFTSAENDNGESQECVTIASPDVVLLKAPRTSLSARLSDKSVPQTAQRFQFSKVYGPEATQRDIFDGTVKHLVKDVLEGGNSLVFTYGVTNAGKTFTFLGSESESGVLPRSLDIIFNSIDDRIYKQMNIKPHRCREYIRLTKDQQDEEVTNKRNIMRLSKETDSQRSMTSQLSSTARTTILEGSTLSELDGLTGADCFNLDVDDHTKYSIWVSFCEIYNENIHDLLEPISNGPLKRNVLRLSQDVKGNSFVKDLKWVQVNDVHEAYKVVKVGKRNQSFSCTKLNNLSSRSHSIFSIRVLRIEDVGIPRVHTVSELSLCDLAGSERCAKTQNCGDRLKEAGNINTSLLILGKCINALRHNQQSKLQQHVPFRESKLTHYLQGFFCGRGKACMIVNINQCASMYDETLNVLKFSAVAQKVVVLNAKPLPVVSKKSCRDVSFIINNADRKNLWVKRKSSLVGWETSLEDVQEHDDNYEEEEDEEGDESSCVESVMNETIQEADGDEEDIEIDKDSHENQLLLIEALKQKLRKEEDEKLTMESRIREEVTKEFMQLFSQMEDDYSERLAKEREIIEERAERRLEILKNLVSKNSANEEPMSDSKEQPKDKVDLFDGMIDLMQDDLEKIKKDAEAAQTCLVSLPGPRDSVANLEKQVSDVSEELLKAQQLLTLKSTEVDAMSNQTQKLNEQLDEAKKNFESQTQKFQELMEICQEKDDMIFKLQTAMDQHVETAANDRALIDAIREEILNLRKNCKCSLSDSSQRESRKRSIDLPDDCSKQPPSKKATLEENSSTLDDENKSPEESTEEESDIVQQPLVSTQGDIQNDIKLKDERLEELKQESISLERKVSELVEDLKQQTCACEAAMLSLETERKEKTELVQEREILTARMGVLQQDCEKMASKLSEMECEVHEQTGKTKMLSEELKSAKTLLMEHNGDTREMSKQIESLTQDAAQLGQELEKCKAVLARRDGSGSHFHQTMDALHKVCEDVVNESSQKNQQIQDLDQEVSRCRQQAAQHQQLCEELKQELDCLREERRSDLERVQTERQLTEELRGRYSELEAEAMSLREQMASIRAQTQAAEASSAAAAELEQRLAEKDCAVEEQLAEKDLAVEGQLAEKDRAVEGQLAEKDRAVEEQLAEKDRAVEDQLAEKDCAVEEQLAEKDRAVEEQLAEKDRAVEERLAEKDRAVEEQLAEKDRAVEERLAEKDRAVEERLAEKDRAVEERLAEKDRTVEEHLAEKDRAVEERLAEMDRAVEERLAEMDRAVGERLAEKDRAVEEQLAEMDHAVEDRLAVKERLAEMDRAVEERLAEKDRAVEEQLAEKDRAVEERLAEMDRAVEERLAEMDRAVEEQLAEKDRAVEALQRSLEESRSKLQDVESASLQEARKKEAERRRELLKTAEEAIALKGAELEKKTQQLLSLKEEVASSSDKIRALNLDLERKEEDSSDMKEKLADSKRQIQQVQKEISSMREEAKSLRQKLSDAERLKSQALSDLHSKDQYIQQLKSEQACKTKADGNLQHYQKACADLQAKEQVIEGMRLALMEQEETQAEQDQVLEDKLDEIESLNKEISTLKERFLIQNDVEGGRIAPVLEGCNSSECKRAKEAIEKTEENLKLSNEKRQSDKKKWLEEKLLLIHQVKEAEEKRNQDIKKFADYHKRHTKLQAEVESLSKQLSEKGDDLVKWRKERDTLVAALEIKMRNLAASNLEKDQKLKELQNQSNSLPQENIKKNVPDMQRILSKKESEIPELRKQLTALSKNVNTCPENNRLSTLTEVCENGSAIDKVPFKKPQDISMISSAKGDCSLPSSEENEVSVLDSSDLSTQNGRPSRFPKPELEIQFTPLQPNKMCVKQQGDDSAVTVKITRSGRKRKSAEMDKDPVDSENRKNTRFRAPSRVPAGCEESPGMLGKRTDRLRQDHSRSSLKSKKDGTLQKIGDFIQSSPNLLGSKAKKIIGLVSAKSPEPSLNSKPKKSKRRLYKTEISSPFDIPSHPIICVDQDEKKESDHLIIKRKLRTRTAKI